MLSSTQERHRREMFELQHKYDTARLGLEYWNVDCQDDQATTMEQPCGLQPLQLSTSKTNGTLYVSADSGSMAPDELNCRAKEAIPASVAMDYKDHPTQRTMLLPWIGMAFAYCLPSWLGSFVSNAHQWACQLLA